MISGLIKKYRRNQKEIVSENFSVLKQLYELPTLEHKEETNKEFFGYVKQRHFFLVVAAFDMQGRLLMIRDFSKDYGWELLGGSINNCPIWDYNTAAEFISKKILNTSLFDVQPIAFLKNNFSYRTEVVIHEGIALIGRINEDINPTPQYEWGFFKRIPASMFTSNRAITALAHATIRHKHYTPAAHEVISTEAASLRYRFHRFFIAGTIGRFASRQLRKAIVNEIGKSAHEVIIDTSCGDDSLSIHIAHAIHPAIIVCNDICVRHLHLLKKKSVKYMDKTRFIFTNHDLLDLPFRPVFDVVISKNTMHHLISKKDLRSTMLSLIKLGKRIIIIDVDNPAQSTFLARLWHFYYVYFLDDQGSHFLNMDKLTAILKECAPSTATCEVKRINTLRGVYLLATIDKHK